jgi:hypothetical protein
MKNTLLISIAAALLAGIVSASAQEAASAPQASAQGAASVAAAPIQYAFNLPKIEGLPMNLRPMGEDKIGCKITYLVAGNGITEIVSDSLKIESITSKDGKDISKNNRGRDAWSMDRFPRISDDGKLATFSIFVATDAPTVMPNIKASLNMKSADRTETARLAFKTSEKGKTQKAGPLTFSVAKNTSGGSGMFSFDSIITISSIDGEDDGEDDDKDGGEEEEEEDDDDDDFNILMKGDISLVAEIKLEAGGKTISRSGHMSFNNKTTYSFSSKPATPDFTLVVTYFADIADTKITIGK